MKSLMIIVGVAHFAAFAAALVQHFVHLRRGKKP
jgi:hypothetical protein